MDLRAERVIAVARLALALAALASLLRGTESLGGLAKAAPVVAGLFAAYSIGVVVWLLAVRDVRMRAGAALLCGDLVWITSLVFAGGTGEAPPYMILYVFVLLSTGLRWGMRETLTCAGICSLFSVLLPLALLQIKVDLPFRHYLAPLSRFELNDILLRTVALLVVGYLIGYLAEREKRIQRGLKELAQKLAGARVDRDLTEVVGSALAGIRDLYDSSSVTVLFYDFEEEQLIRCALPAGETVPIVTEVAHLDIPHWINLDNPLELPTSLTEHLGTSRFCWTHFVYQVHLGWLFVVDPQMKGSRDMDSFQEVADQMGPVLEKMFLLNRVRREAIEEERNRIARDFHDGPLQSFYSFELYLEVLRQWLDADPQQAVRELETLRKASRRQGQELREFIQNMRPVDVEAATLLTQIRALADDFQKTSNLDIHVLADSHRIRARRRLCRELYQIAREALNNIRRHSEAAHAVITLEQDAEFLTLIVDDDGRGFDFAGGYDLEELDRLRLGPVSIKQRVRSLGAELHLESQPGHGSNLQIRVPLAGSGATSAWSKMARSATQSGF